MNQPRNHCLHTVSASVLGLVGLASLLAGPLNAKEAPHAVRLISSTVRKIEERLAAIEAQIQSLPEIPVGHKGGSLGFHAWTRAANDRTREVTITLDLGRERPIEAIVLVPANVVHGTGESRGYGFPPGFRVEVAHDPTFTESQLIADHTKAPHHNPSPAVLLETACSGRYVRVTATELWVMKARNRAVFALGEVLVFSHGRNVAPGKSITASDSIEGKPLWSVDNLVDGQSSLGSARDRERSETNGYHSRIEDSPDRAKWVQIDLGRSLPIDEIRVFPARPIDWAESHGFGFPEHFRIEAANTAALADPVILIDHSEVSFPNPGDNPIVIPVDALRARFVRFTATQLWKRADDYVFALAEMQVFSHGTNVALGSPVEASDTIESGLWFKEYLVDGFDSQHHLRNDELKWLRGIVGKQALLDEADALEAALSDAVGKVSARLVWLASAIGIGLAALAGFSVVRGRALRQRETNRIRERIASDLHDEIGSNLGSIALLSELGSDQDAEMAEINRIARETAESMHDIAWVIRSGHDTVQDLILRMREAAATLLKNVVYTFEVTPADFPDRGISLDFKRNVLLFFKEALHNILQHANAAQVAIRIEMTAQDFSLAIHDDGCGFDPEAAAIKAGGGLKNLVKRAKSLNGRASIESNPDHGVRVAFSARYS